MNISKRTWILLGVAIIAILAAFASLYFEKEEVIKLLVGIEPDEPIEKKTHVIRVKKEPEVKTEPLIPADNGNEGK
jgi:hypothetical protein